MSTYRDAGVDIEAGERAVELMRASVARTAGPRWSAGSAGSPGCSTRPRLTRMRRPLLATSTDGVGTKVAIAQRLGSYDTIGIDLVGMVVDDLVVCGAEPLFMTDYIACGKVHPGAGRGDRRRHRRGLRAGRLRADRRRDRRASRASRARTSTTWPAPPPAWSTPTTCSARTGCGPATW